MKVICKRCAKMVSYFVTFPAICILISGCVGVYLPSSNSTINEMSAQEFESAVMAIKVGDSQESVRKLLSSPTQIYSDHQGNTSWEYDDTQVGVLGVGLYSRNDHYKFAIIIFDKKNKVAKTKLNVR